MEILKKLNFLSVSVMMISAWFVWLLGLCLLAPSLSFTVQDNLIKQEWEVMLAF